MILQYDLQGELLKKFEDVSEAAKEVGIDNGSIHKVLRGERSTAGGFMWKDNSPIIENVNSNVNHSDLKDLLKQEGLEEKDVKSVKIWQTMKGETRYSIVTKESTKAWSEFKDDLLHDVKAYSGFVPKWDYRPEDLKNPIAYEISLPDFHYGKLGLGETRTPENLFLRALVELVEKAKGLDIEKFVLPVGNDGMNSEGYSKATTRGTPQHDVMGWKESFVGYWKLIAEAVNYLVGRAPVDIVVVQGNHDFERMFYAGEVLDAWFSNNENVTVDNNYSPRKYYEYGVNMIMYTHGDKIKPQDMPLIMATEQPEMFARTIFREAHCGHVHKEQWNEYRGIKVKFLPSICPNDEWHKQMGYEAMRVAQGHIWNKDKGYEGFNQVNVKTWQH